VLWFSVSLWYPIMVCKVICSDIRHPSVLGLGFVGCNIPERVKCVPLAVVIALFALGDASRIDFTSSKFSAAVYCRATGTTTSSGQVGSEAAIGTC
jgi:hypothetical protein